VKVILTAVEGSGAPATGLTAAQFRAFEGDNPLAVDDLSVQRLDLGVAIVIDVSGSMEGAPLAAAQAAAIEFTQGLAPNDRASLFAFSNDVRQVVPVTTDKQAIVAGIQSLQAAGDTALYDAAQTGVYAANTSAAPRRAVVFLSDGENAAESPVTADGALGLAGDLGVPVYAVAFGDAPDTSFLQQLAAASNGLYLPATTTTVRDVYANIGALLDTQYTLSVSAPAAAPGGASSLRVQADIAGAPAEASADFTRPGQPAPPETPPAASTDGASTSDGSSSGLVVLGGVAGVAALGLLAVGAVTVARRTRTRRRQLAVVAGNLEQAEAQGVPMPDPSAVANPEDGTGRLTSLDGVDGGPWPFASRPIRIGTAPECEVRVPWTNDVAPQHALVWMRNGNIMLRHIGGQGKRTLVAGRPVEWVILESGDELTLGSQRFSAEVTATNNN
jgi:VWFA-related protein